MFTFTPLYGAQSASKASSSILEFNGEIKILIDVGWDAKCSSRLLKDLESHTPTISVVLLTHPTIEHIGAYVYACKNIPLFSRIPVYATIPVINLGLTLLTDLYASSLLASGTISPDTKSAADHDADNDTHNLFLLPRPTNEEIARYFNRISPLKYSQPHQPSPTPTSPSLSSLTITAYAAGHTLGGTIWHLQHGLESIVYAADWNQSRENLLGSAAWLSSASGGAEIIEPLRRPTALICSSRGVQIEDTLPRKRRDDALIALVRDTVVQGGKVLIPTDSSARVLEIAYVLNQAWRDNVDGPHAATYKNAKVYLASRSGLATQQYLQSMLEWMDDSVIRNAEAAMTSKGKDKSTNPLEWNHVHVIEKQSQLDHALKRSKSSIILASDSSLEWGYSRYAFEKLAPSANNLVILTELPSDDTATDGLLWTTFSDTLTDLTAAPKLSDRPFTLRQPEGKPLDAEQDEVYTQYLTQQRAIFNASAGISTEGQNPGEDAETALLEDDAAASDSSESDDDEADADTQHQGRILHVSSQLAHNRRKAGLADVETGVDQLLVGKAYDFDVQGKRGRERVFPFRQMRRRKDDFGEPITVGEYLRAEEKEELDTSATETVQDRKVGEKRKWDDVSATVTVANGHAKRAKTQDASRSHHGSMHRTSGQDGNAVDEMSSSESEESEYDPDVEEEVSNVPRRVEYKETTLMVSARLRHVDFSALHDKRDLLMLIPLIRPRKLILFGGTESDTMTLLQDARQLLEGRPNGTKSGGSSQQAEVAAPVNGETIDASVDTNAWTLKLGRDLLKKLTWQDIHGIGIVALTGVLTSEQPEQPKDEEMDDTTARKKRKLASTAADPGTTDDKDDEQELPVLNLPAASTPSYLQVQTTNVNRPIHVGDLRLSDLRNLLRAAGHTADFRGEGTLLVDGIVVVRKGTAGRIEVEGNVFGTSGRGAIGEIIFDDVKRKVYQGLAVVGAGQTSAA